MNRTFKHIAFASTLLIAAPHAMGSLLTGGNFADNCSIADWEQHGNVAISGTPGNCAAMLSVDDVVDFETELTQAVALSSGIDYLLNVDFSIDTTTTDPTLDDVFSISLLNQDFDFIELFSTDILAAQNFSESLTIAATELASYANQDWSLSFFLFDGADFDDNQSSVSIAFSSLDAVATDVPEPSSLALLVLGCAGILGRKKRFFTRINNNISANQTRGGHNQ
ncbi:MAG: PEP-CTERM sorting domain-containing protein [Paraglaciecola chathamensis]